MRGLRALKLFLKHQDVEFRMKRISLILFGILIVLFSLVSVSACDEAEMKSMMTGEVAGHTDNLVFNSSLGILSLIRELLIIVVLVLLIIFLIKKKK